MARVAATRTRPRGTPALAEALRAAGVVITVVGAWHVHGSPIDQISPHFIIEQGVMAGGMMLPLAASSTLLVAERSLRRRRKRAVTEHVGGFVVTWMLFASCASVAVATLQSLAPRHVVFASLAAAAAAWQVSDRRRLAADRCGYVHVGPAAGWRCDLHTVAAGSAHALPCLRTCGPAMGAMIAAPHPLVMLAMFGAYLAEWMPGANPFGEKRSRRPFPVYAALTAGAALVTVF